VRLFIECHDLLLKFFLIVCEKSDVVVGINYESIFSENNLVIIAKLW